MAAKGTKYVPIKGSSDQVWSQPHLPLPLTDTFCPCSLSMQAKQKCLPRVQFPSSFSFSFNPKHSSNEEESIKVLNDIITPYVAKEREKLGLNEVQATLLIMNVFKGQMTDPVLKVLSNNNILLQNVPANFIYLFQPLDV